VFSIPNMCNLLAINLLHVLNFCGPGNVVGIAPELWAGRPGDRITVGTRISAHVQTGTGAQPASCTMGTGCKEGSGRDAEPSPLLVAWSRKSKVIPLHPL